MKQMNRSLMDIARIVLIDAYLPTTVIINVIVASEEAKLLKKYGQKTTNVKSSMHIRMLSIS